MYFQSLSTVSFVKLSKLQDLPFNTVKNFGCVTKSGFFSFSGEIYRILSVSTTLLLGTTLLSPAGQTLNLINQQYTNTSGLIVKGCG